MLGVSRKGVDQSLPEQSSVLGGRSLSFQEMHVTPVTIFINEKRNASTFDTSDGRKHLHQKPSNNGSRRPSFANHRPVRHRMMSHDSSASDAEQVTELRRRLVALDSLRMSQHDTTSGATPLESDGPATPKPGDLHRADSVTSVPSTNIQDPSISGKTARSRASGSIGTESAKAAPAIGASPATATGQLEIAAHMRLIGLESRMSQPGSPQIEGHQDSLVSESADRKPYNTTYEGRDPAIISLLETAWQETGAAVDEAFHTVVSSGSSGKRRTPRSSTSRLARDANREVTLIAHLPEHICAVAGIIVSPEFSYFTIIDVVGGITTWETSRLERSISTKPRLRLQLSDVGKVTAVCAVKSTHCFAVACATGAVEVIRISASVSGSSLKLSKIASYRRHKFQASEGYAVSMAYVVSREFHSKPLDRLSAHVMFFADDRPCLLLATSEGLLQVVDLTTMQIKHNMQQSAEFGRISAIYVDSRYNWFVTGTSEGILTLWDLRYQIAVRQWSGQGRVLLIQGHPGNISGNWIVVSYGSRRSEASDSDPSIGPILFIYDVATSDITQVVAVSQDGDASIVALRQIASSAQSPLRDDGKTSASKIQSITQRENDVTAELDPFTQEAASGKDCPHRDILAVHCIQGSRTNSSLETGLRTVHEAAGTPQGKFVDEYTGHTIRQAALMITAGEDRIVRLWNLSQINASIVISGSGKDAEKVYRQVCSFFCPGYLTIFPIRSIQGDKAASDPQLIVEQPAPCHPIPSHALNSKLARAIAQEKEEGQTAAQHSRQLLRPHLTAITAVASFETPFSSALILVTGDRSGVVKVWRIGSEL